MNQAGSYLQNSHTKIPELDAYKFDFLILKSAVHLENKQYQVHYLPEVF